MVVGVVAKYWKAASGEESRRWPLRKPTDLELGACHREADELSDKVGKAAAALSVEAERNE